MLDSEDSSSFCSSFCLLGHMELIEESSSFYFSFCRLGIKLAASVLSISAFCLLGQKLGAFGKDSSSSD
tara:strand:+ start:2159 stop:2365 length:207 start_codon:yes stop_codon:yes gene_type:complete